MIPFPRSEFHCHISATLILVCQPQRCPGVDCEGLRAEKIPAQSV